MAKKALQTYAVKDDDQPRELPPLTWQLLSQPIAGLLLAGSLVLWLRLLITFVDFSRPTSIGEGVVWVTSVLIVLVLAIGCAFVPPIFWSAIIPSTVASNVLSWLYAKYGTVGYYFCFIGALVLTAADLWLVMLFWTQQIVFQDTARAREVFTSPTYQTITLCAFSGITVFLFVGFTAWALNRMTPRQLVAGIVEAQNAAEVLRAEKLKDVQFQVTYARAVSILRADLLSMGVAEFGERASEFAAIVADMEQHEARAFRNMAELIEAQGFGEDVMNVVDAQNDPVRQHYRHMILALKDAADYHQEVADYGSKYAPQVMSNVLAPPDESNVIDGAAVIQQRTRERQMNVAAAAQSQIAEAAPNVPATLERSSDVRLSPPQADQGGQDVTLGVILATFGRGMFNAAAIALECGISQRSAERLMEGWKKENPPAVVECRIRGTYKLNISKEGV